MTKDYNFGLNDNKEKIGFSEYVGGVKADISCKMPFLYKGLKWQAIWDVFGGVVSGNRIEVKSTGWILKSPMATKL